MTEHYYGWGSRAAGGKDICVCGKPRGACPEKVDIVYTDGSSVTVDVPSEDQLESEWQEVKGMLDKMAPGWDKK